MPVDPKQGQIASLIISVIILVIVIILIVIVCCNWNNINNTNTTQPVVQNPQALAAAAMFKKNQGQNINAGVNLVKNNPQKAALGAYAYNKNNFGNLGCMSGYSPINVISPGEICYQNQNGEITKCKAGEAPYQECYPNNMIQCPVGESMTILLPNETCHTYNTQCTYTGPEGVQCGNPAY